LKTDEELLKIITHDVKNSICDLPVITPTIFTNYFQETAKKYDVSLEDEYEIAKNLLEETCTQLSQLES